MFGMIWGLKAVFVWWMVRRLDARWRDSEEKRARRLLETDLRLIEEGAGTVEEKRLFRERLQQDAAQAFGAGRETSVFERRRAIFRKNNRYRKIQSQSRMSPTYALLVQSVSFGGILMAWEWMSPVVADGSLRFVGAQLLFVVTMGVGAGLGWWRYQKTLPTEEMPLLVCDLLKEEMLPTLHRIEKEHDKTMDENEGVLTQPIERMDQAVVTFVMAMHEAGERYRKFLVGRSTPVSIRRKQWARPLQAMRDFETYLHTREPWSEIERMEQGRGGKGRPSADVRKTVALQGEIEEMLTREGLSPQLRRMAEETKIVVSRRYDEAVMESRRMNDSWQKEEDMATLRAARRMVGLADAPPESSRQTGTEREQA